MGFWVSDAFFVGLSHVTDGRVRWGFPVCTLDAVSFSFCIEPRIGWLSWRRRLLAAEKTDRASVQKRFFSQQRMHHDAVPGAAAAYGAPAPSGGTPGRGSTAGAGGRTEARSSRKDVLASLDLLALSQDGTKRGRPARRATPLRPAGDSAAASAPRPPPANYHRSKRARMTEEMHGGLPDEQPMRAGPSGERSAQRNHAKRRQVDLPAVPDRVVRQRVQARDVLGVDNGFDASPSYDGRGVPPSPGHAPPPQSSSAGEISSLHGIRLFENDEDVTVRFQQRRRPTPSSSTLLDYRRGAPLADFPRQADDRFSLPPMASAAFSSHQAGASLGASAAAAATTPEGPPSPFCSVQSGRGPATSFSLPVAATYEAPEVAGRQATDLEKDCAPAYRPSFMEAPVGDGERRIPREPDAAGTGSGNDSLRVAPRSMHRRLDDGFGVGDVVPAPIARHSDPFDFPDAFRSEGTPWPPRSGAHVERSPVASWADEVMHLPAEDERPAGGRRPRPAPFLRAHHEDDASGRVAGHPHDDGRGGPAPLPSPRSIPSSSSCDLEVNVAPRVSLRVDPIAPSALSAELGVLERKFLGVVDEATGSAFCGTRRARSVAGGQLETPGQPGQQQLRASLATPIDVARPHGVGSLGVTVADGERSLSAGLPGETASAKAGVGDAGCSVGIGFEAGSSARQSFSSSRHASNSSHSVSNPLASTSCHIDAGLA